MGLTSWADSKLKKLSWADTALTKVSCFVFGILLAKLIPGLIEISVLWIVVIWIVLAIKPLYGFLEK